MNIENDVENDIELYNDVPLIIRQGDCLQHENPCIIAHCCNDIGGFGSGFVAALNNISDMPRNAYMAWHKKGSCPTLAGGRKPFALGETQFVYLYPPAANDKSKIVANIIGQHQMGWDQDNNEPPVKYWAIEKGLRTTCEIAKSQRLDVVSPLLGCGLAGGDLGKIFGIIYDITKETQAKYYFYAFSDQDFENVMLEAEKFCS